MDPWGLQQPPEQWQGLSPCPGAPPEPWAPWGRTSLGLGPHLQWAAVGMVPVLLRAWPCYGHVAGQRCSVWGAGILRRFGRCHQHLLAQVITGGHYDVDCYVEDPNGRTIYRETKKQYDSFPHHTEVKGIYTFCFSNEFSTFSHKTVYFNLQVGDEPPILPDMSSRVTALTQVRCATWLLLAAGGRCCCSSCWWLNGTAPQDRARPLPLRQMQKCQPPANRPCGVPATSPSCWHEHSCCAG